MGSESKEARGEAEKTQEAVSEEEPTRPFKPRIPQNSIDPNYPAERVQLVRERVWDMLLG